MNGQLFADAVQAGITVIKGAVLAVGILAGLGVLLAVAVGFIVIREIRRHQHDDDAPQPFEDITLDDLIPGDIPPAPDNVAGINLADLDDCERIWPDAELNAGCARLRAAIEEQHATEDGEAQS